MPNPDIAGLLRVELLRARSAANALAGSLGKLLDNPDSALPDALAQIDDALAEDVIRMLGSLENTHELHDQITRSAPPKRSARMAA